MNKYRNALALFVAALLAWPVLAQSEEQGMTAEQFEASLHYQQGTVTLLDGKVSLAVPNAFRYLNPADSKRLLEDAWGNPPGQENLGMLFPADISPLDREGWGIIITYSEDGHISDEDADAIDYTGLLSNMQDEVKDSNEERTKYGYPPVELVGWAEAPYYDKATRKYHWAKELKFGDAEENTLNYNIRILGREGVLVLNAVAGMHQVSTIKNSIPDVLAFTNFSSGNRYEDFNASTDKMATYGLAALVGGLAAKKLGLLAVAAAFFVKFWKLIMIGLAAIGGLFYKRKNKGATA